MANVSASEMRPIGERYDGVRVGDAVDDSGTQPTTSGFDPRNLIHDDPACVCGHTLAEHDEYARCLVERCKCRGFLPAPGGV